MPVARLFWLALVMAAAIILTWEVIVEAVTATHTAKTISAQPLGSALAVHGSWRLPIIAVSASIMVLVIATGEALLHLVGVKPTPAPPPVTAALPREMLLGEHGPPVSYDAPDNRLRAGQPFAAANPGRYRPRHRRR